MRTAVVALLVVFPAAAQDRFEQFDRDVMQARDDLRISKLSAVIFENNREVWIRNDGVRERMRSDSQEFSQTYAGERIVWSFTRSDYSSSLRVNIPSRKLTLTVVAESKAMTEAPHLEDGNIARSAIVLAFLEQVVFGRVFPEDELENRAFTALYFGQREQSAAMIQEALQKYPQLQSADDVTLLHLLAELHLPATEAVATTVLKEHPDLPTAWLYYGRYLRSQRRFREATLCFKQITEHQPPLHHWSVAEAEEELNTLQ